MFNTMLCITNETTFSAKKPLQGQINTDHFNVHPLQKNFRLPLKFYIDTTDNPDAIRSTLYSNIREYIKSLFRNFLPYAYMVLQRLKQEESKVQSKVGFKEFVCWNITMNLMSMTHAIRKFYVDQISKQRQKSVLKTWLCGVVQNLLQQNIIDLKDCYPQSLQDCTNNSSKLKQSIKRIDITENEQYDIFLLNNIKYSGSAKLIMDILFTVNKMCQNGYKLQGSHVDLKTEISLMFQYILSPRQNNPSSSLADYLQKAKTNSEAKCKIKETISFEQSNKQSFEGNLDSKQGYKKLSPFLRIMTKFIQNIHGIIESPQSVTINRNYNYKTIDNQLVRSEKELNEMLYNKLLNLRDQLNKGENGSELQKIKTKIFQRQRYYLFDPTVQLQEQQLKFSQQNFVKTLEVTREYLEEIIKLIIKAGEVEYDGKKLKINLLRFNLGDLFRTRKSVTTEEFLSILKHLYQVQQTDSKTILKLLRIKDKTQTDAKGVLINVLFKNKIPCQIQINTKQDKTNNLYQICHLLYQFQRGQFGALTEILNIIATQHNYKAKILSVFIQCKENTNSFYLNDFCQQKYKSSSQNKELKNYQKLQQLGQVSWIKIKYEQREKEITQNRQGIQYVNQSNASIFQTYPEQNFAYDKIKYVSLNGLYLQQSIDLLNLSRCRFMQRLSIRNYGYVQKSFQINSISFIKSTGFIKTLIDLDLSNNCLVNLGQFAQLKTFQCLKKLNLSNNLYTGKVDFMPQWLPQLQNLQLSNNKIEKIIICDEYCLQPTNFEKLQALSRQMTIINCKYVDQRIFYLLTNDVDLTIQVYRLSKGADMNIRMINQENRPQAQEFKQPKKEQTNAKDGNFAVKNSEISKKQKTVEKLQFQKQFQKLSQYLKDFKIILKNLCGIIVNINNNKQFPCVAIGNSNILMIPAHYIINTYQAQLWKNRQQQKLLKKIITERLRFFSAQQLEKNSQNYQGQRILQVWICQQYIFDLNLKKDMALLFLTDKRITNKIPSHKTLSIVFHENNQQIFDLLLSGTLVGFQQTKKFESSFASIFFNNSDNSISCVSQSPSFRQSGTTACYIRKNGANYQIYILGLLKEYKEDQQTTAMVISKQFLQEYRSMINSLMVTDNQTRVEFINYLQFKKRIQRLNTVEHIICTTKNILPFISKLFKKFSQFLGKYLFFDTPDLKNDDDDGKQLLEHIYISDYYSVNENEFEIDLFGFPLLTIFDSTLKKIDQKDDVKEEIQRCQIKSVKFILKVLYLIKEMNQNHKQPLQIIISIFEKDAQNKFKSPNSLMKILLFIAQFIDFRSFQKIKSQFSKQLAKESFDDKNYFKLKIILPKLNSIKRIQYFAQVMRVTKFYQTFAQILQKNVEKRSDKIKKFQKRTYKKIQKDIKKMNGRYYQMLNKFVNLPQNQQYDKIQIQFMQKWFLIAIFKKYYQINLSNNDKLSAKELLQDCKQILIQKIERLIKANIKQFNIQRLEDISKLNEMFIQNIQKQLQLLKKTLKIIFYRSCSQQKIVQRQKIQDRLRKKYVNPPLKDILSPKFDGNFLGNFQYSNKDNKKIIKSRVNKEQLHQNIGIVLLYNDPTCNSVKDWKKFASGTGVLIEKNIVITAAHIIKPALHQQFCKGKIRFLIQDEKGRIQITDVLQVRFLKNHDVAFLILQTPIPYNKLPLTSFSNNQNQISTLEGKHFYCKLVGYEIDKQSDTYQLTQIQGLVFIQRTDKLNLQYKFPSYDGQQGGVIVFYPTGNLNEPYILGIHTTKYKNYSECIFGDFIDNKYSYGTKILFQHINQQKFLIISVQKDKSNIKIPTVSDLSSQFSEHILFMGKWSLINNLSMVLDKKKRFDRNIKAALINYRDCWNNGIILQNIHEDNILCFNYCFNTYFNVNVRYEKKKTQVMKSNMVNVFEDFMNRSRKQAYTSEIIEKYLRYIHQLRGAISIKIISQIYMKFMLQMRKQIQNICKPQQFKQKSPVKTMFERFQQYQQFGIRAINNTSTSQMLSRLDKIFQLTLQCIENDSSRICDFKRIQKMKARLRKYNQRYQLIDLQDETNEDKMKNVDNYFNNQFQFIQQLSTIHNYQDKKIIGVKYQIQKILHEVIYQFYLLCFEKNIKFKEIQIIKNLILDEKCFKQFTNSSDQLPIQKIIIDTVWSRWKALKVIDELAFLQQKKKEQLIRVIYNWENISEDIGYLLLVNVVNVNNSQDQQALKRVRQHIINIYTKKQSIQFSINKPKVMFQQLKFLQQLNKKFMLDKKISSPSQILVQFKPLKQLDQKEKKQKEKKQKEKKQKQKQKLIK